VTRLAESFPAKLRLPILRFIPLVRVTIFITAVVIVVPIVIEPTLQNVIAFLAAASLVIAFVFKDYASSLVASLVTIFENLYQPGDWIEMDGTYGEVKLISLRAVHIVTPDDDEVMIPHYRFWTKKISNSSSGSRSLMCVANFYLNPDHDGRAVYEALEAIAKTSPFIEPNSKIAIAAQEKPWGTHYKIKAYVHESREQFIFINDLTLRAKAELRAMRIQFAQAVPAVNSSEK
jgi:small-conductance mechanosensitive channel